jgi:hypothetical protein
VLHRLVEADPAAWNADVPQALAALTRRSFALPSSPPPISPRAAAPSPPRSPAHAAPNPARRPTGPSAALLADQPAFDLLDIVWRTGGNLPAVLDHLRDLATPLTHSGDDPPGAGADADGVEIRGPRACWAQPGRTRAHLPARVRHCRVRAGTAMPGGVLDLTTGALASPPRPVHRRPRRRAVRPRPAPSVAGRRVAALGRPDPALLFAVGRGRGLAALRAYLPGRTGTWATPC